MRHLAHLAIWGLLAGCAAHTDPAPPTAPEKDPTAYPSGSTPSGGTASGTSPSTPASGSSGSPYGGSSKPASGSSGSATNTRVATAAIDTNLARLKALQIFEVGGLLLDNLPAAANCYGLPCPGQEQAYADAKEVQATRLADFTETSVAAAAQPVSYNVVTPAASEQNLNMLRDLAIVGIGGLIVAKPVADGNCYGPCPAEIAACDAINAERANKLSNIAKAF